MNFQSILEEIRHHGGGDDQFWRFHLKFGFHVFPLIKVKKPVPTLLLNNCGIHDTGSIAGIERLYYYSGVLIDLF